MNIREINEAFDRVLNEILDEIVDKVFDKRQCRLKPAPNNSSKILIYFV